MNIESVMCPACGHDKDLHDEDGKCWFKTVEGCGDPECCVVMHCDCDPSDIEALVELLEFMIASEGQ